MGRDVLLNVRWEEGGDGRARCYLLEGLTIARGRGLARQDARSEGDARALYCWWIPPTEFV